eukprot:CAMPEP_0179330316 /NCGR_PEP_ID=MMETSP0797-20121207/63602_1 /TAXON_ID=47934 /ORGANISM="Dinophysis acuminata, Strain DAEP01" /LENGTH=71 /DNA_ID=CAMNT_0021043043 /DNA_START=17 /DNA_END=229 /DNA_ORIENTATION=-
MEDRLRDWRRTVEEDARQKHTALDQNIQKISSGVRVMAASFEDTQKRQKERQHRFEVDVGKKLASHKDTRD